MKAVAIMSRRMTMPSHQRISRGGLYEPK